MHVFMGVNSFWEMQTIHSSRKAVQKWCIVLGQDFRVIILGVPHSLFPLGQLCRPATERRISGCTEGLPDQRSEP